MINKIFENQLMEIEGILRNIYVFNGVLKFIVLVLFFSILAITFMVPYYYSVVPALFLTVLLTLRTRNKGLVANVTKKYKSLDERLDTAYDNKNRRPNFVLESLLREVSNDLRNVSTGMFFSPKKTMVYVLMAVVLSGILLLMGVTDFKGVDIGLSKFLDPNYQAESTEGSSNTGHASMGGSISGGIDTNPDIYGSSSVAKIKGEDIEMEIHPEYNTGSGASEFEDPSETGGSSPIDVTGSPAELYSENIPVRMEELVRKYFEKISEEE